MKTTAVSRVIAVTTMYSDGGEVMFRTVLINYIYAQSVELLYQAALNILCIFFFENLLGARPELLYAQLSDDASDPILQALFGEKLVRGDIEPGVT